MQDLNDLYYYVQVVDHGGFAPAGRALGIPKSKLSRRIALLEERLGVRLIQRSTRRFAVTEIGQTYYGHCKAMLVEAEAADDAIAVMHAEPRGIVRLACPVALLDARVAGMVAGFMVAHPRVEVHLEETNRRVDVVGEGVDIALRAHRRWRTAGWSCACWRTAGNTSWPARNCSGTASPACPPTWRACPAWRWACRNRSMSGTCSAPMVRMPPCATIPG